MWHPDTGGDHSLAQDLNNVWSTSLERHAVSTINRPPDRDEWLTARRPYFNASAAAALFHEHPFLTLAEVVRAKLEPNLLGVENAAMRRGRHLEQAIAGWWSEEHGIALYEPEVMYVAGPLLATLDRRIVGNDTEAVEIKTTAKHVSGPERYWWWQVQGADVLRRAGAGPHRRARRFDEPRHLRRRA